MTSITIALVISTLVFVLFPTTRIFSAVGLLLLTYLYPLIFTFIAAVGVAGYAYHRWSHP